MLCEWSRHESSHEGALQRGLAENSARSGVEKVTTATVLECDGQRARAEARRPVRTVPSRFQGEREGGCTRRPAVEAVRSKGSWTYF